MHCEFRLMVDAAADLLLYLAIVVFVNVALVATDCAFAIGLPYTQRLCEM